MTASVTNGRFMGMLVAVAVSFATVLVPLEDLGLSSISGLRGIGLIGAPVAALLGWWLTPSVAGAAWRVVLGIGVGMGVLAAVLGVFEIAYVQLLQALAYEPDLQGSSVTAAAFLALIGLPYAMLALPVTIPCGLAWAITMRAILPERFAMAPDPRGSIGVWHLLVVLGVGAVGAALGPVAGLR
jgi:hypothetical protein